MSIDDARKFIRTAAVSDEFRKELNKADGEAGRNAFFESQGLSFNFAEFDEAFTNLVGNCQTREEHMQLEELRMWWEMLLQMNP